MYRMPDDDEQYERAIQFFNERGISAGRLQPFARELARGNLYSSFIVQVAYVWAEIEKDHKIVKRPPERR